MQSIKCVVIRFVPWISAALVAFSIGAVAQSQTPAIQDPDTQKTVSLGDVARQQRTDTRPKAKRVITEDDIKTSDVAVSQPTIDKPKEAASGTAPDKDKLKKATPEDQERERAKPFIEAVGEQKKRIAEAQKNLQGLQRRLHSTVSYPLGGSATGTLGDNAQKWEQDAKANQDEIARSQRDIQEAQAKIEDIREQARKAGVRLPD